MKNILVLGTGNSCRSQIAEGWLRYYAGGEARVYSAGIKSQAINMNAVKVMAEEMIDISAQESKTVDKLPSVGFDYVITLSDTAREECPGFPAKTSVSHKLFPDPAGFPETEKENLESYEKLRDEIEDFCFDFIHNNVRPLIPYDIDNVLRM